MKTIFYKFKIRLKGTKDYIYLRARKTIKDEKYTTFYLLDKVIGIIPNDMIDEMDCKMEKR